jgi:hypothetical protein
MNVLHPRPGPLSLTATVLRSPHALLDASNRADDLAWLMPRLLGITLVGAGVFGMVVGTYRGGVQLAYAGIKMPALLLLPLIVCLPAVRALYATCRVDAPWARLAVAGLTGTARTSVLAAALGPVLWLLYSLGIDYHLAVLVLAAMLAVVGLPGLVTVARAMPAGGERRWLAAAGTLVILGGVTAQTGWLLRPFVARPHAAVAFLRPIEGDITSSLTATTQAAGGNYQEWEPEEAGLLGRGISTEGSR